MVRNGRTPPPLGVSLSLGTDSVVTPRRVAFMALLVVNVVWLVLRLDAPPPAITVEDAYAACRSAIRRLRPEAARIPFPTADLIRVSRGRSGRVVVRGYYVASPTAKHTRYTCELASTSQRGRLGIDTIVVQP